MSMTGISNSYNNYVTQNTNDTTKKNVAKSNSRQVEFKEFNSEISGYYVKKLRRRVMNDLFIAPFAYTGLSCKTTNCKLCSKVLQGVLRCYD